MMADPTVTYAGWVFKEGSLVKNWKKRFLVVKRRELAYYKTTDHTSRHAQLLGAMRVMHVEKAAGITNGLIISSLEGRQLKIFMDTAAERDRCYATLAEWCHPGQAASAPPNVRVHGVVTAPPRTVAATAAASRARMAGWLEKQGQNMPTWKRRYFVLEDGVLTYSQHEGGSSLARHRVLGVRRDRTRAFTLALTLDTGRELRVSATSEHDLEDWTRALRETIQVSPSQRPSGHASYEERSSGIDQRGQLDDSQASYNNLFGAPPAAVDDAHNYEDDDGGRRSTNMSFGHNIRLDFDGENTSFIECAPPELAAKPWSPKAPGVDTIRRMRIEQNLLVDSDDDDDEFVITRVASSTQQSSSASGSSSPVPSRRPHNAVNKKTEDASAGPGPCCCIVM